MGASYHAHAALMASPLPPRQSDVWLQSDQKTNQGYYHGEEGTLLFCRVTVIFLIKNTLFLMSKTLICRVFGVF